MSDSRYRLSEALALELAATYGTPLYVIDEQSFRSRIRAYLQAFRSAWPRSEISYASKANSTAALLSVAYQEGCHIDVASEGEFRAALKAGVPASRCHFHGNNKQSDELQFALYSGVGVVVVDHFGEIDMIRAVLPAAGSGSETRFVIRLAPGVDPVTHAKIATGQADTKFGFNIGDGSAEEATRRCLAAGLDLYGFHCHVGSQLLDPEAQRAGGELIARFAVEMKIRLGYSAEYLNVGGGLGVSYTDTDIPMRLEMYNRLIAESVRDALAGSGLAPILGQEPGRSLIAEAGVTLYRVGVIKTVPAKELGTRTYVAVDGGLSDNPRPALYGSKYTVEMAAKSGSARHSPSERVTISGKHCETDKLFDDVELGEVQTGDLIQVLCTGAYNASMASNYNRYPRPATALVRADGKHVLIQRRDTYEEMLARELVPEELIAR
jgi:diaminopimelate decarboxylase